MRLIAANIQETGKREDRFIKMDLQTPIKPQPAKRLYVLALGVLAALLLLGLGCVDVQAAELAGRHSVQQQQSGGDYNNLENLISDLLDDASYRQKKTKQSSMRQVKQTLRFGRRSDPLMAPTFGENFELAGNLDTEQGARWSPLDED